MLNCVSLIYSMAVFLVVNVIAEDGFTSRCDFNNTLFVQKGRHATFIVNDTLDRFYRMTFYRTMPSRRTLLYVHMHRPDIPVTRPTDHRVNCTITDESGVIITLHNVTMDDYGIYENYGVGPRHCWELFPLDIWNPQNIAKFEENLPAYFDATPRASNMVRPRVNATSTWLLDGLIFSRTADFIEQDGRMIIMRMRRHLNTKNVTYRITEDNGDVHDVNLTLSVLYGPYSPLNFNPSRTSYIITSGDNLPDITCSTDCNPPCETTWDRSGIGNVLSLGKVYKSSKGMYTCLATRNGTDRVVERNLYIEVNDETAFIVAVSVLGTMQGITLIIICVFTVCWHRTSERNCHCLGGIIARTVDNMKNRTKHQHEADISTTEMEHYEGLDCSRITGAQNTYENLQIDTVAGSI